MNIVMDSVGVSCRLCGASLIDETREDAIAAWNARAPTVPEGWQLVPVVPTEEMLAATCDENRRPRVLEFTKPEDRSKPYLMARYIYPAMLAAAPKVPA